MEKRKYTIYAVDFDGTLCEDSWPDIGKPNCILIPALLELKANGDKLILWTCRTGDLLVKAVAWCKKQGLEFDAINENLPEMIGQVGSESRKVFADIYIDDKSISPDLKFSEVLQ